MNVARTSTAAAAAASKTLPAARVMCVLRSDNLAHSPRERLRTYFSYFCRNSYALNRAAAQLMKSGSWGERDKYVKKIEGHQRRIIAVILRSAACSVCSQPRQITVVILPHRREAAARHHRFDPLVERRKDERVVPAERMSRHPRTHIALDIVRR